MDSETMKKRNVVGPSFRNRVTGVLSVCGLIACTGSVQAHHPMGGAAPETAVQGMVSGLAHPVIGIDHLIFLVVAGVLLAGQGVARRIQAGLLLVVASGLGTMLHLRGVTLPLGEVLTAGTVVVAGVLLAVGRSRGAGLAGFLALAGVLHGYAFGEAVIGSESGPVVSYLAGLGAMELLIVIGASVVWNWSGAKSGGVVRPRWMEGGAGMAAALAGLFMMLAAA